MVEDYSTLFITSCTAMTKVSGGKMGTVDHTYMLALKWWRQKAL